MSPDTSVCAVIVTYRCGAGVVKTVESVLPQVARIVIVDNGGDAATREALEALKGRFADGIELKWNPENLGIAGGLNVGVRSALDQGFSWILTLDHDSVVSAGMVDALLAGLARYPEPDKVGIVAPRYIDRRTRQEGLYRYYGKGPVWRRFLRFGEDGPDYVEPTEAITSGSLVRADLFRAIGLFNERLFIDYVDIEFCLRAVVAGFRILIPKSAVLLHELGAAVMRTCLGKEISISNHGPVRRYFIARNRIYLMRKYGFRFPSFFVASVGSFLLEPYLILRFEGKRWQKMAMIARGMFDGLLGRLGTPFAGRPR